MAAPIFLVHTADMAMVQRLSFVEEISEHHYAFRYGAHDFAIMCQNKCWCLLRNGCATALEGDNLHDALYQVIRRFQSD